MKTLGVIGLGYVGLPLAVQAAEKGYTVTGIDLSQSLVDRVNNRQTPFVNDERFAKALSHLDPTKLNATISFESLKDVEYIVICVPTPTASNVPDLSYVTGAASEVAKHLRPGHFIGLESTVNPGVTRDIILPILERGSGLKVGVDFTLAHCPERIDPGNIQFNVSNLNRVVGGITAVCTNKAVKFYESIIDAKITPLDSTEEAEFVKSWENSHRNMMIAMANSAAQICDAMDMNIDNVLKGLQSKVEQFGLNLATPGIGPGGHCIPEDIHYVIQRAREANVDTRFLSDAADLNDRMPQYAVHKLVEMVQEHGENLSDLNVALLGLAYKPNIDDMRRSPAIEAGFLLARIANSLTVHDPYAGIKPGTVKGAKIAASIDDALHKNKVVFVGSGHDVYKKELTADGLKAAGVRYVLDGRNCLNKESIIAAGIAYKGIGK